MKITGGKIKLKDKCKGLRNLETENEVTEVIDRLTRTIKCKITAKILSGNG
ncbi:hypothetical protein [Psychrobacillus vulpis]|uniref:hypothetical protein n=1 Tax=Psychrobacillus vulpis TaxID=2325572 RepID=UPI00140D54DB|nr:hypothetical protein [Psychrobacillus vulpis]